MRGIITVIISLVGIYLSVRDAFYGLLTYAFWSYTYPEKVTWGLIPIGKLSFAVGITVVITTIMQKKRIFIRNPKVTQIIIFWALTFVGVMTANFDDLAQWQFQYFTRIILITLILTVLVDNLDRLRAYFWSMAIFIGLVSAQSGVRGTLAGQTGGASTGFEGIIGDRNYMAVLLCTIIPIVYYISLAEKNKKLKLILQFTLVGDALAVILTYARAGFLGMAAIGVAIFVRVKQKIPAALAAIILFYIMVIFVVPESYKERLTTIKKIDTTEEDVDKSATGRIAAWKTAIEMMKERPLSGVGFYHAPRVIDDYQTLDNYAKYGDIAGLAIHNSLLQVGAELGVPALILYIYIFYGVYTTLGRIKRYVIRFDLDARLSYYASMLQVAFIGYFSTALFVNCAFIDISWHLAGLTVALEHITRNDIIKKEELMKAGVAQ